MMRSPDMVSAWLVAASLGLAAGAAGAQEAGKLPAGWKVRTDDPAQSASAVQFADMAPGWHLTTGDAHAILWHPDSSARGNYRIEVETFLFQLEEGQLCPVPVRSRYGYHVLVVDRRIDGRLLPFEAVHKKIAEYLEERVWRQAVRQYVELLVGSADIQGIDLKGSVSPLVQ